VGKLDIHMLMNEIKSLFHTTYKNHSELIKDLNLRLENNRKKTRERFMTLLLAMFCFILDMTPKHKQ
jgi:hypothetical protein